MRTVSVGCLFLLCMAAGRVASAQEIDTSRVYRCPDNSYTNMLSVVREKHCQPVDNANISVLSPTPEPHARHGSGAARRASAPDQVSPGKQSERDAEARQLLQSELQTQQAKLAEQLQAYQDGHPERLGNEHNYQKYLDRVQSMKQQIDVTRANIDALQRELQRYSH
jgi:hypothetical protein